MRKTELSFQEIEQEYGDRFKIVHNQTTLWCFIPVIFNSFGRASHKFKITENGNWVEVNLLSPLTPLEA